MTLVITVNPNPMHVNMQVEVDKGESAMRKEEEKTGSVFSKHRCPPITI
jgi:hypothetical protein